MQTTSDCKSPCKSQYEYFVMKIMNHFLPLFFWSLLPKFFVKWDQVGKMSIPRHPNMFPPQQMSPHPLCQGSAMDYFRHIQLPCPCLTMNDHFQTPELVKWEDFQTCSCREAATSHSSSSGISQLERTRNLSRKATVPHSSYAVLACGAVLLLLH